MSFDRDVDRLKNRFVFLKGMSKEEKDGAWRSVLSSLITDLYSYISAKRFEFLSSSDESEFGDEGRILDVFYFYGNSFRVKIGTVEIIDVSSETKFADFEFEFLPVADEYDYYFEFIDSDNHNDLCWSSFPKFLAIELLKGVPLLELSTQGKLDFLIGENATHSDIENYGSCQDLAKYYLDSVCIGPRSGETFDQHVDNIKRSILDLQGFEEQFYQLTWQRLLDDLLLELNKRIETRRLNYRVADCKSDKCDISQRSIDVDYVSEQGQRVLFCHIGIKDRSCGLMKDFGYWYELYPQTSSNIASHITDDDDFLGEEAVDRELFFEKFREVLVVELAAYEIEQTRQ